MGGNPTFLANSECKYPNKYVAVGWHGQSTQDHCDLIEQTGSSTIRTWSVAVC